jgi:hypothetical protein
VAICKAIGGLEDLGHVRYAIGDGLRDLSAEDSMKDFIVRVGGFYVNESKHLVREITHEDEDGNVHWRSYELETGTATGDSLACSPSRIVQWAAREATPEETARMNRSDAVIKQNARTIAFAEFILKNIPDEQLFAEVHRRGRRVL